MNEFPNKLPQAILDAYEINRKYTFCGKRIDELTEKESRAALAWLVIQQYAASLATLCGKSKD